MAKQTQKKVRKKLPEGCGPRKKGAKDSPATTRRRVRESAAFLADLEQTVTAAGHKSITDAAWWWASQNEENMTFLMHHIIGQRLTADIDPVKEDLMLAEMETAVKVAEAAATASGEKGGGQNINIYPGALAPTEAMRLPPPKADMIEATIVSDDAPMPMPVRRVVPDVQDEDL